jgi:hypothetical protein
MVGCHGNAHLGVRWVPSFSGRERETHRAYAYVSDCPNFYDFMHILGDEVHCSTYNM